MHGSERVRACGWQAAGPAECSLQCQVSASALVTVTRTRLVLAAGSGTLRCSEGRASRVLAAHITEPGPSFLLTRTLGGSRRWLPTGEAWVELPAVTHVGQ